MEKNKNRKNQLIIASFLLIFFSCSSIKPLSKIEYNFQETDKVSDSIDISYNFPEIKLTPKTEQTLNKGGVIISAEIETFKTSSETKRERQLTYSKKDNPDYPTNINYDRYEITNTPSIKVTPENIVFHLKIRNNEDVPLKLAEIGFAIIIDGIQWSFPTGYLDEWNKGLVLSGFEKTFTITGPQINGLGGEGQLVYLFLNGVPTSYDQAGSVTKKENFEWYFQCKNKKISKKGLQTYEYSQELVYKEKCKLCLGSGIRQNGNPCHTCKGSGLIAHAKTPSTVCKRCNGSGLGKLKCGNCGGTGIKTFPKSPLPPENERVSWNGWVVKIKTIPSGAIIKTNAGQYSQQEESPSEIDWLCASGKNCPIEIEYQGKKLKVLPYKEDNSRSSKITVDFSGPEPIIKGGQKVN